jgi:hypothetical protein
VSDKFANQLRTHFNVENIINSNLWRVRQKTHEQDTEPISFESTFSKYINSKISVLLIENENYLGNLAVSSLTENAFDQIDVQFLRTLAPSVSNVLSKTLVNLEASDIDSSTLRHEIKDTAPTLAVPNQPQRIYSQDFFISALNNVNSKIEAHKIKLEVQSGFPMVICDPKEMTNALTRIFSIIIRLLLRTEKKVIQIGFRDEVFESLFFIRYNGPKPLWPASDKLSIEENSEYKSPVNELIDIITIIENQGGKLRISSGPESHSEISFTLPKTDR